jgi:hypothetical protein
MLPALLMGIFGVASVSHAQYTETASFQAALQAANGGVAVSASAASLTVLEKALASEATNNEPNLVQDFGYLFQSGNYTTLYNGFQSLLNYVLPDLTLSASALNTEYQNLAAATSGTTSLFSTLALREDVAYGFSTTAKAIGGNAVTAAEYSAEGSATSGLAEGDTAANLGLIAQYGAYPISGSYASSIPLVYEAVASVETTATGQAGVAAQIYTYNNYASEALTTATGVEQVSLTASFAAGGSGAALITADYATAIPTDTPYFATEAASDYPTYAAAVSGSAAAAYPADAALIATDVAGAQNVSSTSAAAIAYAIDSLSSTSESTRLTVAENVIAVDRLQGLNVSGVIAPELSVVADEASLAYDASQVAVSGSNYSQVPLISSTIAAALTVTTGSAAGLVAQNAAYWLYSAGLYSLIPGVYETTASNTIGGAASTLAEQAGIIGSIYNYSNYSSEAFTTATNIEQISIAAGSNRVIVAGTDTAEAPYYALGFADQASVGQSVALSATIGATVDENPTVNADSSLAAQVAVGVADTSTTVATTSTSFNDVLYTVGQVFGAATGTSSGQISPTTNLSVALALSGSSVFTISNQNSTSGEYVNDDVIAAISSAFTNNKAFAVSNPNSLSNIESVLNNLISQYPENAADILGSVIATSTVAANNASALKTYVDSIVDNSTLLHDIFGAASLSISQETALANNDILAALQIATDEEVTALGLTVYGQNAGGLNYNGYNGNGTGLTPDETPVVDM